MRAHGPDRPEAPASIDAELTRAKKAIEWQGYTVTGAATSGRQQGGHT